VHARGAPAALARVTFFTRLSHVESAKRALKSYKAGASKGGGSLKAQQNQGRL
jgi:hypothetical protein